MISVDQTWDQDRWTFVSSPVMIPLWIYPVFMNIFYATSNWCFPRQVKNKPHDGVAICGLILESGAVTNINIGESDIPGLLCRFLYIQYLAFLLFYLLISAWTSDFFLLWTVGFQTMDFQKIFQLLAMRILIIGLANEDYQTITYQCSVSRWRPQKVDKRMVLEHTHGLFIT